MLTPFKLPLLSLLSTALLGLCATYYCVNAQAQETEDVVRVETELVQTDVMVFDKQGRFVNDLKRGQFVLKIDGKPQPITFFELVAAGSVNEEAQLAAARGQSRDSSRSSSSGGEVVVKPLDRGRTIFFFIDDLHLSANSLRLTRNLLLQFIEKEMGQNDQMLIASATGQLGFLQQLLAERTILRMAVERLKHRSYPVRDMGSPPMTEMQALAIERYDPGVTDVFVQLLLRESPNQRRDTALETVRGRARSLIQQVTSVNVNLLASLEHMVRTASPLSGRKLLFFISDGFLLSEQSDLRNRMRHITDAAARAGVVIYSMDARGLTTNAQGAASEGVADRYGRLQSSNLGESSALQNALYTLAADTGGRALVNTNSLDAGVETAVKETSLYYLLAWRPEGEEEKNDKFRRIDVDIEGRPDLVVRVRRGYLDAAPKTVPSRNNKEARAPAPKTSDGELRSALTAMAPRDALPTFLSANFVDLPNAGATLIGSMQVSSGDVAFASLEGKQTAVLNIAGVVFDTEGKSQYSFKNQLKIEASSPEKKTDEAHAFVYTFQTRIAPGLYQVRVAAYDEKSGQVGSAMQWIEIPDLKAKQLSLSSLLVGERKQGATGAYTESSVIGEAEASVNGRFSRSSYLRFLAYIYNATRSTDATADTDVALQVQVFRDDQPVVTTPLRKVQPASATDATRLAYAAEIPLKAMPPGRYLLQVTVIDRIARTTATRRFPFEVE
jgi:VWFA-related protein